jgi:hypothetical protein
MTHRLKETIMNQIILHSLIRQAKGSELLCMLLQKEYALLREGRPDQVAGLEMAVQELIRQLVREREFLIRRLNVEGFSRLGEYVETLSEADQHDVQSWQEKITAHEQDSARQASVNADLAMALWEQSGLLLSRFQKQVAPTERNTYTARGTWNSRPTPAALVHGRL